MRRVSYWLILILLAYLPTNVTAQEKEGSGIIYGSEAGVLITAPKGWIFDSRSGLSQGLHAVMYPAGFTWENSNQMMYVNIVKSSDENLEKFIDGDVEKFKANSSKVVVEKSEPISMAGNIKAEVRMFSGDAWGNYECIAYAPKGTSVVIFVLSSRNREGLLKNLDLFKKMVSQSSLMTVSIEK